MSPTLTTSNGTTHIVNGTKASTSNDTKPKPAELDASKLIITECKTLKPIPPPEGLVYGKVKTDYMLVTEYEPKTGWSAPEIKPYGPLSLDPASSCLQYCPNVFEGMKAYLGPDGKPRLFRPQMNMERLARSIHRAALPSFNTDALLTLIKRLITLESRWIPNLPGYSLYIRPTVIGTRTGLGVAASDSALLYIILSPTGPYFRNEAGGSETISLLAVSEHVRAWPGGTGGHKLGLNYASSFLPQSLATERGYDQILWLLPEPNGGRKITEVGAMNFFVAVKREDGDVDIITPSLDGTILPGVTRESCLHLVEAHSSTSNSFLIPGFPATLRLHAIERTVTVSDLEIWAVEGNLVEIFCTGTAAIVASIGRIGLNGLSETAAVKNRELVLPESEKMGPIAKGLFEALGAIQTGRLQYDSWSVVCS